jgi:hypothetical protein
MHCCVALRLVLSTGLSHPVAILQESQDICTKLARAPHCSQCLEACLSNKSTTFTWQSHARPCASYRRPISRSFPAPYSLMLACGCRTYNAPFCGIFHSGIATSMLRSFVSCVQSQSSFSSRRRTSSLLRLVLLLNQHLLS